MKKAGFLYLLLLTLAYSSCHKPIPATKAFYYWRSSFNLSPVESKLLDSLSVQKLYVKYFELRKDSKDGLFPADIIAWKDTSGFTGEIVPVVFIPNQILIGLAADSMAPYAQKIYRQIELVHPAQAGPFKEIQIDCDWTDKTRAPYFSLLQNLQAVCKAHGKIISATLRLHQVKYLAKTGVPPVNRAMLMFYNMGHFDTSATHNSILDLDKADKYIARLKHYPLPVDVALPVFSWGVQMRDGKVIDLLHNFSAADAAQLPNFTPAAAGIWRCDSSRFYRSLYFKQGDILKTEQPRYEDIIAAENKLRNLLPFQQRTLILFDIDTSLTAKYNAQKIQSIYTGFN